jgi:hypothetical protein
MLVQVRLSEKRKNVCTSPAFERNDVKANAICGESERDCFLHVENVALFVVG